MDYQEENQPLLGRLTLTSLTAVEDLFREPERDAWSVSRAPFSRTIARLSAELAAGGYDLNIRPWIQAGWGDCTFVVENRVVVLDHDTESRLASIESEWKRRRARSLIHGVNPINDLVRAVRQLMVTDLGKSIVMTRAMPDGRAVVAISFIGTTQKYFDWFSNFKIQQKTGMHEGFVELAHAFDEQATRILLPGLAAQLGEDTLSLADALLEARRPDSRVSLWISGHSQGGALVQTYTHLLMERGVPAERIHGYSFAAPTVASVSGDIDPKAYPIYNIVNADDIVPRVGSQLRLGVDCVYKPDSAFRQQHYRVEEEWKAAFDRVHFMGMQVQTTEDALCWAVAFLRMLRDMGADGEMETMLSEYLPLLSLMRRVNLSLPELAGYFESKLSAQALQLLGARPDETLCAHYEESIYTMMEEFGAKTLMKALLHSLGAAHRMSPDKKDEAFVPPYIGIARRHLDECAQGVWLATLPPRCVTADGEALLPAAPYLRALVEASPLTLLPEAKVEDEKDDEET